LNLAFVPGQVAHDRVYLGQRHPEALRRGGWSGCTHIVRLTTDPVKPNIYKAYRTKGLPLGPVSHSVHIWAMEEKRRGDIL
jgi:hypothetical protein